MGRCGRRERSISGRESDSSNHRARNRNDFTLYWKLVGTYTDSTGQTWYGERRPFTNTPINTSLTLSQVGHVIIGDAKTELPNDWVVIGDDLRWPKLFNLRCNLEVYCRWHGLRVPKNRAANLLQNQYNDTDQCTKQMLREIHQMNIRLRRIHMIEEQKKYYKPADYAVESIMEDPDLASDYELSDYSDDDLDGDFQHYLPIRLMRDGKSMCCHMNTMEICPTYFLPLHKNFAICFPIDVLCCSIPCFPHSFVLCLCCYLHVILIKVVWIFLRNFWIFLRNIWTFLKIGRAHV